MNVAAFAMRLLRIARLSVTMPCDPSGERNPLISGSMPRNKRHLHRGGGKRLRAEAELDERFDEHALRAADGTDGGQPAFANPDVDGATRHGEQGGCLIDGDAAAKPRFESRHCTVHECP